MAWAKFLIASVAILHVIEGSSKHTPQGRQWYGAKRTQCRKDPLILYLYQARNEEEHGVEPLTKIAEGGIILHVPEGGAVIKSPQPHNPDNLIAALLNADNWGAAKPTYTPFPPRPALLPVTSREGDVFNPPKEHLGKPLGNGSPDEVATLFLAYLKALVEEADKFS